MLTAQQLTNASWECVHFCNHTTQWDPVAREVDRRGLVTREASCKDVASKEDLLKKIALTLDFPDYFGNNWDALAECLRDLSWLPADGYVLALHDIRHLWATQPEILGSLVEIWLFCAKFWADQNTSFHLVFTW